MRLPIHREGIFLSSTLVVVSLIFSRFSKAFSWFFAGLSAFCIFFFRDPDREIPEGEGLIVAPADGTILKVDTLDSVPFLEGSYQRISIFLSVFNVHINRSPIEGKIVYRQFVPGRKYPANMDRASSENEQNSLIIDDNGYKVMVKQIAGILARRIVCWVDPGAVLERGERFGLIRFGSRTELFLPSSAKILVKPCDGIRGGETIVGKR